MRRIERWIPRYGAPWLWSLLIYQLVVYMGTKITNGMIPPLDMTTALDGKVPFVPAFILPYILTYVFWVVNYILIARESPENCKRVILGALIAKTICLPLFIFLPTTMERASLEGSGILMALCRFMYRMDTPTNLFPSIHCLDSWICWRGLFGCQKVPRWYKACSFVFALIICASTVLVKQHVLADIPAGILVAEAGLLISNLIYRRKREVAV